MLALSRGADVLAVVSRRLGRASLGWLLVAGVPGAAGAQGLINVGRAELGLRWQNGTLGQTGSLGSSTRDRRVWLLLPISGSLPFPRLLSYGGSFNPVWFDGLSTDREGKDTGNIMGYGFWGDLFSGRMVSLSGATNKSSNTFVGSRGEVVEATSTDSRISAGIRTQYISLQGESTRRQYDGSLRFESSDLAPVRTSYDVRSSRLSLVNSKLRLALGRTRNQVDNPIEAFTGWDGSADHSFQWGKGSFLGTRYYHLEREGDSDVRQTEWSETLHLQHTRDVQSDHVWRRSVAAIDRSRLTVSSVGSRISARLSDRLSAGLTVNSSSSANQDTDFRNLVLTPNVGFSLPVGGEVEIRGAVSTGFERSSSVGELETVLGVIDERHDVGPGLTVTLRQARARAPSVVIRSLSADLRYQEGVDYLLSSDGVFVTVKVLPGGRIREGDVVLVTYEYVSIGVPLERAIRTEYSVAISRGGLELSHSRSLRDVVGGRGDPILLKANEFGESRSALDYRAGTRFGDISLNASTVTRRRNAVGRRSVTTERAVGVDLSLPPMRTTDLSLAFYWGSVQVDSVAARTLRGSVTMVWNPFSSLRVQGRMEGLVLSQTGGPTSSRYLTGTTEIQWRPGQLEVDLRFDHLRYDILQTTTVNRLVIQAVRKF